MSDIDNLIVRHATEMAEKDGVGLQGVHVFGAASQLSAAIAEARDRLMSHPGQIADAFSSLYDSDDAATAGVPEDLRRLVIAARIVAYEDQSPEALEELDKASEAFAELVPWDDQPQDPDAAENAAADAAEAERVAAEKAAADAAEAERIAAEKAAADAAEAERIAAEKAAADAAEAERIAAEKAAADAAEAERIAAEKAAADAAEAERVAAEKAAADAAEAERVAAEKATAEPAKVPAKAAGKAK